MTETVWIITAPKGGRRRAGRRWEEGETAIAPEGAALWDAVEADPRMSIREGGSAPGDSDPPAPTPEIGIDAVIEAIRGIGPSGYTQSGKPKTEAIEARLGDGASVPATLRDAAWRELTTSGFSKPTIEGPI